MGGQLIKKNAVKDIGCLQEKGDLVDIMLCLTNRIGNESRPQILPKIELYTSE